MTVVVVVIATHSIERFQPWKESPVPSRVILITRMLLSFMPLGMLAISHAQQGPIDPNWVYITPVHWKHAPRGINESWSFADVAILYPEGQYLEISAALIKRDKDKSVGVSNGDGLLLRTGTWSRTDEQVIRIHSREVFWSTETVSKYKCDQSKNCKFEEPHPEPFSMDTCGFEGRSPTHLAQAIRCKRIALTPARLNLDLIQLQTLATEAFHAAPLQ